MSLKYSLINSENNVIYVENFACEYKVHSFGCFDM